MRVQLKGINRVRKRLSNGRMAIYYYHRATGQRLAGAPDSDEFLRSYSAAEQSSPPRSGFETFDALSREYELSPEFKTSLATSTQKEYARKLAFARAEFHDLPVRALNNPEVRGHFMKWRAMVAEQSGPREADYRLAVVSTLLSWAVDNGRIHANHVKGFKRLYKSHRSELIWLPDDIATFMGAAPVEMQRALILALHTGLRQGDIRKLCWSNYDGAQLTLRIGKNQRGGQRSPLVSIPCTTALKAMLDSIERRSAVILSTKEGRPFTARYFGRQWEDAIKAAGMEGSPLHFHDLRGTAVTMLAEAGCTVPQIVAITQHSLATATRILESYLTPTRHLASQAIAQFENATETKFANRLQTRPPTGPTQACAKG